jgi:hypothetical protein
LGQTFAYHFWIFVVSSSLHIYKRRQQYKNDNEAHIKSIQATRRSAAALTSSSTRLSVTEDLQGMDENTKLEQLRFLSETHRTLHEQRRRIEQRVLLTTLSLYVLAAFAVLKGEIKVITTGLKLGL